MSIIRETVYALIRDKMPEEQAQEVARALSEGRWTHDYPVDHEQAKALGLPVSDDMPREIYDLMDLYPQTSQQRPWVEFIPMPYHPPQAPRRNRQGPGG